MLRRLSFVVLCCVVSVGVRAQEDPFAAGVRTTPWLKPEEEQKLFKLPDGFEIELVAAEPKIQKPLNMAFDNRGRLWVTDSVEYPYAASLDKPARDTVKILEDTDRDGTFDKITTFADNLNIPIGVYPYGNGCIVWSIPNLWHLEDMDGDGVCDRRTKLYGPFDYTRDVHGNLNAFRRGWDGWIYGCHGFNNDSKVKGADGHEVHMQSGNTYRFRVDGSRIEHLSRGQVNPFGMTFDPLFNIFTADCHSKPLTQILRGACYESFGKPHDGLGYVPSMMQHLHGSTAIGGAVYYEGENFPPEYRGNLFCGNVMTSRINRDTLEYHGSTIAAKEAADFLIGGDPWFRPVDFQIGPDGALYVADFYNRIIGHYEVPLPHPGRDRTSGRLWRVKYVGKDPNTKPAKMLESLREAPTNKLIEACDHPTLTWRSLAQETLLAHPCSSCPEEVAAALPTATPRQKTHLLWVLERLQRLTDEQLLAAAKDDAREVRVHAQKVLSERPEWTPDLRAAALTGLKDADGFVARSAADAIGRHPLAAQVRPLLERLKGTSNDDSLLRHTIRMALRDHLTAEKEIATTGFNANDIDQLASIALAAKTPAAAGLIVQHLQDKDLPKDQLLASVRHAIAYVPPTSVGGLIGIIRKKFEGDLELQAELIRALDAGLQQRSVPRDPALLAWAEDLVTRVLAVRGEPVLAWTNVPLDGKPFRDDPWVVQGRPSQDGVKEAPFYGSLPRGEQKTGVYRSQPFELPKQLTFYSAGHVGPPGTTLDKNYIRLRDAETDELLMEARPPRNDLAQKFKWDLSKFAGRRGRMELVDGDEGNAYAWLAVGRFSVPALNPSAGPVRQRSALELAGMFQLTGATKAIGELAAAGDTDPTTRQFAVKSLAELRHAPRLAALAAVVDDNGVAETLRQQIGAAARAGESDAINAAIKEAMKQLPARLRTKLAEGLAADVSGAEALLQLIEGGHASATLLRVAAVDQKLKALKDAAPLQERAKKIVEALPPENEAENKLLAERMTLFQQAAPDLAKGRELFTKHCASCHQVEGKGAVVGPQLDGIGNRGAERVLEDVLAPNRNVDVAFRTTALLLNDDRVLTLLVRREEGNALIGVDPLGKEVSVPKADIAELKKSALSLMPSNVAEILPPDDFSHLAGYLLSLRGTPKPQEH